VKCPPKPEWISISVVAAQQKCSIDSRERKCFLDFIDTDQEVIISGIGVVASAVESMYAISDSFPRIILMIFVKFGKRRVRAMHHLRS